MANAAIEMFVQQDGYSETVNMLEGEIELLGSDEPRVLSIGVLMDIRN